MAAKNSPAASNYRWPLLRWRKAPGVTRGPLWWAWFRITRHRPCSDEFLYRGWVRRGRV